MIATSAGQAHQSQSGTARQRSERFVESHRARLWRERPADHDGLEGEKRPHDGLEGLRPKLDGIEPVIDDQPELPGQSENECSANDACAAPSGPPRTRDKRETGDQETGNQASWRLITTPNTPCELAIATPMSASDTATSAARQTIAPAEAPLRSADEPCIDVAPWRPSTKCARHHLYVSNRRHSIGAVRASATIPPHAPILTT